MIMHLLIHALQQDTTTIRPPKSEKTATTIFSFRNTSSLENITNLGMVMASFYYKKTSLTF